MGGVDTNLAAAALAIALVAYVTALAQLLQQYFAPADGYRRCQHSVMGGWASRTRLRWRWREFRFETLYTTPEIFMAGESNSGSADLAHNGLSWTRRKDFTLITGSPESRTQTFAPPAYQETRLPRDTVCWIPLLHFIHIAVEPYASLIHCQRPAISFEENSWDFQLPDIVRPLAKTSVSAIAIIARRMEMRWREFRPVDGIMIAEGNAHIMTATIIRSLGILLQYNIAKSTKVFAKQHEEIYIPTSDSDDLGFGVVSTRFTTTSVRRLVIGTKLQIINALAILDPSGRSSSRIREIWSQDPHLALPMADIVAMLMEMIRPRGTKLVQIPAPSDNMSGFSQSISGRQAFWSCLNKVVDRQPYSKGAQAHAILLACQQLRDTWPDWDVDSESNASRNTFHDDIVVSKSRAYMDVIDDYYQQTELFLRDSMKQTWTKGGRNSSTYSLLLGAHIRFVILLDNYPAEKSISLQHRDYEGRMAEYFGVFPEIVEHLKGEYGIEKEEFGERLFDTWVTMLFRACCWGICHSFVPGERVPFEYYGSQLPVYIG